MIKKAKVLYISNSLCSENLSEKLLKNKLASPNLAAQKYHRLFAQGMALNHDLFDLHVVGVPEVSREKSHKLVFSFRSEIERGVTYSYIPIILIPVVRYFAIAYFLLLKIISWGLLNSRKEKIIVIDILNTNISLSTAIYSRLLKIKLITIVTDLPEMIYIHKSRLSIKDKLIISISKYIMRKVDGFVFLTLAMNERVNYKNKPFMIMEGLADFNITETNDYSRAESKYKILLYSGGLYEKDGIKALIEAFSGLSGKDYRLQIYGTGELTDKIKEYTQKDPRITYFGYVDNSIIVNAQKKATILTNPRFSHEEYTKYSFPSKNIEYMASGTPLLTTKLPSIPVEYYDYIFLIENESIDGFRCAMQSILNKPRDELLKFGARAKEFIINRNNNKLQASRFYSCFVAKY